MDRKNNHPSETKTITVFLGPRGGRKRGFQQSGSTQSGAGEKETLNINVVGKKEIKKVKVIKLAINKIWDYAKKMRLEI